MVRCSGGVGYVVVVLLSGSWNMCQCVLLAAQAVECVSKSQAHIGEQKAGALPVVPHSGQNHTYTALTHGYLYFHNSAVCSNSSCDFTVITNLLDLP